MATHAHGKTGIGVDCLENSKEDDVICQGGETALLCSCKEGGVDCAGCLLKRGVDANAKNENNIMALMLSCHRKCEKMAELLLNNGADIHARDELEKTALMHASSLRNDVVARKLIEHGAEINACDQKGRTPLMFACLSRCDSVVELLCKHGADVNVRDGEGRTVLAMAPLLVNFMKHLLEAGADVSGFEGRTLFLTACKLRNIKIMKLLLKRNVDVNSRDRRSRTPLMIASMNRFPEIVELLLQHGADINAQTNKGYTAIMLATVRKYYRNYKCIGILLDAGADLELSDNRGRTIFSMVVKKYDEQYLRLLLESGKLLETNGRLKAVHDNATSTHCRYHRTCLILLEFGIFEWKWGQFQGNIMEAICLSQSAFSKKICPGQMRCSRFTASPIILSFFENGYRRDTKDFIKALYYFPDDYVRLSTDHELRAKIKNTKLLDEFTRNPLPLFTWSFITVSQAVSLSGNPCFRTEKVNSLPLPNRIKYLLKFPDL